MRALELLWLSCLICTMCGLAGCAHHRGKLVSSKWAMDDPDYREKYNRPYRRSKRFPMMAKQMVDARHVKGKGGFSMGASISDGPIVSNRATLGGFIYPEPWLEFNGGLTGAVQEGEKDVMVGVSLAARVQTPTRLAPFVGIGGFGGLGFFHELSNNLNDDWEEDETVALFSAAPEAGIHYWLTSRLRLTGSAGYRVTTGGRDSDHWYSGISLSWLNGGDVDTKPMTPAVRDDWLDSYDDQSGPILPSDGTPYTMPGPSPPPYPTPVPPSNGGALPGR